MMISCEIFSALFFLIFKKFTAKNPLKKRKVEESENQKVG